MNQQKRELLGRVTIYFLIVIAAFLASFFNVLKGYTGDIVFIVVLIALTLFEITIQLSQQNSAKNKGEIDYITLATAGVFYSTLDALLAKDVLESNNIQTVIGNDNISAIDPLLINAVGGIQLQVRQDDLQKAIELLAQSANNQKPGKILCPKCASAEVSEINKNMLVKLPFVLATQTPAPYNLHYKCKKCGTVWKHELPE